MKLNSREIFEFTVNLTHSSVALNLYDFAAYVCFVFCYLLSAYYVSVVLV